MRGREQVDAIGPAGAGGQMEQDGSPGLPPGTSFRLFVTILGLLCMFGPLSIDMYLPGLPQIARDLGAEQSTVQLTLSAFLGSLGLSQLVWGPLGDRYGRRLPAAVGIVMFVVASIGCALSTNIWSLMAWRVVQGAGACAAPVLARAMIRDLFERNRAASVMSLMMLVTAAAPMVAPILGGQVLVYLGWRGVFWVLAGFGVLSLLGLLVLPETKRPGSQQTAGMLRNYLTLLGDRRYLGYALSGGFVFAGMFAYISGTPFVYIEYFKISPEHFGYYFGANVIAMMAMSAVNSRLVMRHGLDRLMKLGIYVTAGIGLVLPLIAITGFGGLFGLMLPLFFYLGCMGLVGANGMAGSLSVFPHLAGSASALAGALQLCTGAAAGALVGLLSDGTPLPMCLVLGGCAITGLILHRVLVK